LLWVYVYWSNENWLKSRFHFNFAEYSGGLDQFGVLRVMNDDLVQPRRGFGAHPHRNMEICTYIVDGELSHKDSMGTQETLSRGGLQYMSAGDGVRHSEHNLHVTQPLRFIQMWILPRTRGGKPNYGGAQPDASLKTNQFFHFVSDVTQKAQTPVKIDQDANIFVTDLDPNVSVELPIAANRQAYVLCVEGQEVALSSTEQEKVVVQQFDAAKVVGPMTLKVQSSATRAHVLVVEMAAAQF